MNKPFPKVTTDEQLEALLEGDLSAYLTPKNLKPMPFERQAKAARINMRLPQALLDSVKAMANAKGMPYQRFIRAALERAVSTK
jgi:predicted DNA binding CopG/RHH family protein